MNWSRDIEWYQGAILAVESLSNLEGENISSTKYAIAISHDCDIANDITIELNIEFISINIVEKNDGSLNWGKNARKLHLTIEQNNQPIVIELSAIKKFFVPKKELIYIEPDSSFKIDRKNIKIIQHWLSARYKRQALPNNLVDRLRPVFGYLENNCKKYLSTILGIWIDYIPHNDVNINEPYELWLNIVYIQDGSTEEIKAHQLANEIKENFPQLMKKVAALGDVILVGCNAYCESEFTLADIRSNVEYRFDYLSYRSTPEGPTSS